MSHEREFKESEMIKVGIEAFVVRNKKMLLGRRINVPGHSSWGLPGGHLEQGESLIGCLERELNEEIGIKPIQPRLVVIDNNPQNIGGHYLHMGFLVDTFEGEIELKEPEKCSEWKFFDLDNLPDDVFSAHRKEIELFNSGKFYDNS